MPLADGNRKWLRTSLHRIGDAVITTDAAHRVGDAVAGAPAATGDGLPAPPPAPGKETILLVEDEASLLSLIARVLRRDGYSVIDVSSPADAARVIANHDGPIDLMLTDMVMPGMTGRELWLSTRALRPPMRCLIMSGYSRDAVEGLADLGVPVLNKPFAMSALVQTVRQVLDAPPGTR